MKEEELDPSKDGLPVGSQGRSTPKVSKFPGAMSGLLTSFIVFFVFNVFMCVCSLKAKIGCSLGYRGSDPSSIYSLIFSSRSLTFWDPLNQ